MDLFWFMYLLGALPLIGLAGISAVTTKGRPISFFILGILLTIFGGFYAISLMDFAPGRVGDMSKNIGQGLLLLHSVIGGAIVGIALQEIRKIHPGRVSN